MRVIEGRHQDLPTLAGRWALTLGTFDGVHRGHQAIVAEGQAVAQSHGFDGAAAVSFLYHPRSILDGQRRPRILTTLRERTQLLASTGLDLLVLLQFDESLAALEYDVFVREILRDRLGLAHFVLGHDVHFGRGRRGNVNSVTELAEAEGFGVSQVASVRAGGEPISSTRIRDRVAAGDLGAAVRLLGHPFPLSGMVVEGRRIGRTLGFPTANLEVADAAKLLPAHGVYAAWAGWDAQEGWRQAVVNIGIAPTVSATGMVRVEAHVLDGSWDLYGRGLQLALVAQVRAEARFAGPEELRAQIGRDVAEARTLLTPAAEPGVSRPAWPAGWTLDSPKGQN